jgi:hypothetical protein
MHDLWACRLLQGGSKVGSSAFKDLWIHGVTLFINLLTMAVGLFQVFSSRRSSAMHGIFFAPVVTCTSFTPSQQGVINASGC